MTKIVLLNNVDHADLCVVQGYGARFGDAVNQALVFPTEFEALQREYVILLRQDEQNGLRAVVLLGLDRDENLFLDGDAWRARTVPAIQRRGPFSIGLNTNSATGPRGDARINVDLDHPRVTLEGGEPVFRRHGGATDYLEQVNLTLATLYDGLEVAGPMYAAWAEAGLIEPVAIDITVGEGRRYDLDNVLSISRDRLAALDGPVLERLHRPGWLAPAFQVASSLANIDRLVEMKNRKEGWA